MQNLSRFSLFGSTFLLALLTGCAGVSRVPLDKAASAKVTSVEAKAGIPADEVIVRAAPSQVSVALGGGLIPALIDASVTKSRQTALETVSGKFYEQVEPHDFRNLFADSFKASLGTPSVLPNLKVAVSSRGISKGEIEERRKTLKADQAFLGMRIWYEFTTDARSLLVAANVQLIAPEKTEPIYTNSFLYTSTPIADAEPLDAWAKNQGAALAAAYRESGKEIARMLKMDIEGPSNEILTAENAKRSKAKVHIPFYGPFLLAANGALIAFSTEGFLVEKNDQRQIVRAEGGALYSVANN
jgi:hypothetical protein